MKALPPQLTDRPFARREGLEAGLTPRVLEGVTFVRVHPRVYRHRDHHMTFSDRVAAAALALPADARTTGLTRLRQLGLPWPTDDPLAFVIARDHHLDLDGVFLHRTRAMPPTDDVGVTAAAAFVAYCATARMIDAIKVGDWLLHHAHIDGDSIDELCASQPWRRGVREVRMITDWLDGCCRSLPESELYVLVRAAGLPIPEVNVPVPCSESVTVCPDLWFPDYRTAVEVEGKQHQESRGQYLSDIDRYAAYRRADAAYVQVPGERLRTPRTAIRTLHRELVSRGYDGPAPRFSGLWSDCFQHLSTLVRRDARSSA